MKNINKYFPIALLLYGVIILFTGCKKEKIATIHTADVTEITLTSAKCGGEISNDGNSFITQRGVCWSTKSEPTVADFHTTDGNGSENFVSILSGLVGGTTYYVRAYAVNDAGTAYGEIKTFTAETIPVTPENYPVVSTNAIVNIEATSATCGGNVTSDGNSAVTAKGVCWSTTQNPTIADNKTNDGQGLGPFTSNITGLTIGTTYYVRAYATNSAGTSYGEQRSFTTLTSVTVNGVSFTMKFVEGGTYNMGAQSSNSSGINYDSEAFISESPVHSVTLSNYYIGETEVTQALWLAVMGSWPSTAPSSTYGLGDNFPAYCISWDDVQNFITTLNSLTGQNFRLPTEAEWEYAARGGNQSHGYKYSGSNTVGDVAWYSTNSSSKTHAVKSKLPNELGIYDMSGNVCEWCQDRWGGYSSGSQTNPTGSSTGSHRVFRGGSWGGSARGCRVSYRTHDNPDGRGYGLGFRLALSL